MTRSDVAGWLLISSFALWFPAATLPSRIWTAALPERLTLISQHRGRWRLVTISIAIAAVLLVMGFAALADPLEAERESILVPLSLIALLLGAALWLASLVFRLTVLVRAASTESPALEAVSAWASGLFLAWTALGNGAVVGFGIAIVRSGFPATWCGWAAIVLAGLILVQALATGDALPALYHVGPAMVGLALLLE